MFEEVLDGKKEEIIRPADNLPEVKNNDKPLHRCSPSEYETRIAEVTDMLLHFESQATIRKFLVDKYGLKLNSCKQYIDEANHAIIANIPTAKQIIGKHIEVYNRIAKKSEADDARTSLLAMNALEKLLHLHQPELQVNNNTLNLNLEGLNTEEVLEYLKALKNPNGNTQTTPDNQE